MNLPNDLQLYLRHWSNELGTDGALEQLETEFGINTTKHPTLPLVNFKYSQIDSPRFHPIVRQCRGTVLELGTWNLVAQPFLRFFNHGECVEEMDNFNWDNFTCQEKADGSLMFLSFYKDTWIVNTSGSFAQHPVENGFDGTWEDLFWAAVNNVIGVSSPNVYHWFTAKLNQKCTYIFEMCSPYTKVVRQYSTPQIYLLGVYKLRDAFPAKDVPAGAFEADYEEVGRISEIIGVPRPATYNFKSLEQIIAFMDEKEKSDSTWEGVVIRSGLNNLRFKMKTKTYLALHRLKGNGNIFLDKNLLPFVMSGETGELLATFPEVKVPLEELQEWVKTQFMCLDLLFCEVFEIKDQKTFALVVKGNPFSSILFTLKKSNNLTLDGLKKAWRDSTDLILKVREKSKQ